MTHRLSQVTRRGEQTTSAFMAPTYIIDEGRNNLKANK